MTNKEILRRAIKKVSATNPLLLGKCVVESRYGWLDGRHQEEPYIKQYEGEYYVREIDYKSVIFHHLFAQAFWGDAEVHMAMERTAKGSIPVIPSWQMHLQQMVLKKNPIKYLEKFL